MPIQVACACGKKLSVKDELAGRRVKCPACQETLSVPKPKAQAESQDDEWDLGDSAEDDFDEERPMASKRSSGGKKSASRGPVSKKGKTSGKSSSGGNRGLLIGLSAGGGLLVVALLAWMLWPARPAEHVAGAPGTNTMESSTASNGEAANGSSDTASPAVAASPAVTPNQSTPAVTGTAPNAVAPVAGTDLAALQGDWHVIELQMSPPAPPGAADEPKKLAFTLVGNEMSVWGFPNGRKITTTITLDPTQNPKAIDILNSEGPEESRKQMGIYSLEGETLKLAGEQKTRATAFSLEPKVERVIVTLQRGRPAALANAQIPADDKFDLKAWRQAEGKLKAQGVPR